MIGRSAGQPKFLRNARGDQPGRAVVCVRTAVESIVLGVLGMKITHKPRSRLRAVAAQFLLGIAGLALITFVCFRLGVGLARTGFVYVILIALVSLLGSFSVSVVQSIVAAACLNYFFAPPLFELRIDVPEDIERIAAFLTTSLVVTALTTRRKRVEEELAESGTRLEEAQRLAHVGWWQRDLNTDRVTVSDEVSRILGVRPVGRWLNLIHPEDRAKAADAAAAALRPDGPRYDVEYRVARPDGTLRVVHSRADVTRDDSGQPLRQFGVLQDITELRRAEQELRTSEARFRTFVDHATDAFFLLDDHSIVLDVNRQACDDLGYSREELIGKHRRDFDVGLDDASIQRLKQRMLAGQPITFETRHRRKDGTSFPVEVRIGQFEQGGHRFLCVVRDITERKRAEDELRASEARFRTFVDHAADSFFLLDDDWTLLDVNRQACDCLGYSREELIGKHKSDLDVGLDDASIQRLKQRMLAGEPITFETRHRRKDGTSFPVEVRVGQFEQGGRRFLCLVRDITERKRAEDERRANEVRFRSFVDHATDGFFLFDEHQALLDVNRQACESLGYSREEMLGMHPRDFDAGLDGASIARIGERVKAGETVTFETLHRRKDRTVFPVEVRARQFQHGAQRFRLSLARDLTERKRAEAVLRESEAKLQKAQRIAHFGWWDRDFTTNQVSLSDEVCRIFGLQVVDLLEWHGRWLNLIHPEDRARAAEAAEAAVRPGGPRYDVEYRVVRPDGTQRIVHSQGDVTWDESGRPLRQFGVLQDVTELRRTEEELRESEERFRTLMQFSFDVYWETDAQHHFIRQEFSERLADAPPPGSEIGKTRWEVPYVEPDEEAWRKHRETMDAHLPFRDFELARPTPDGGKRYVSVSGLPVFDGTGRFIGYRGVGRHITDRKRAEEALQLAQQELAHMSRVMAMGELTASIAHEINQPLTGLVASGNACLLYLTDGRDLEAARRTIKDMISDAFRASEVVNRIRALAKKSPPRKDRLSINDVVLETASLVRNELQRNNIILQLKLTESLPPILGDQVQLQQVLLNLIINAKEAMSAATVDSSTLTITAELSAPRQILVSVRDTGLGFDQTNLDQIFDAFYTTKPTGMGMGLKISRSIIEAHGGKFWATPNQPRGATFQFTLPAL